MKRKKIILKLFFLLCFATISTQGIAQIAKKILDRSPTLDEEIEVFDYLNHTWIQAGDSIFKVSSNEVQQLNNYCFFDTSQCISNEIIFKKEHKNKIYYGTSQGLFKLTKDSLEQQFKNLRGQSVNEIFSFDGYLWFDCVKGIGFIGPEKKGGYWPATEDGEILNYLNRHVWIKISPTYSIDWLARIQNNGDLSSGNFKYIKFLDLNNRIIPDSLEREIFEIDSLNGHIWVSASDGLFIVKDTLAYWLCKSPHAIVRENSRKIFPYIEDGLTENTLQLLKLSGGQFLHNSYYGLENEFYYTLNNLRYLTSTTSKIDSIINLGSIEKLRFSKTLYNFSIPVNDEPRSNNKKDNFSKLAFQPSEIIGIDTVDIWRQHSFGDYIWDAVQIESETFKKKPGVYLVSYPERVLKRVPNVNSNLIDMIPLDNSTNSGFFTTEEGVFFVKSDTIELISSDIFNEFKLIGFNESGEKATTTKNIWILADNGLYNFKNEKLYHFLTVNSSSLDYFPSANGLEYFNSDSIFFSIDSIGDIEYLMTDIIVHSIVNMPGGGTYFLTNKGIFGKSLKDKLIKHVDLSFDGFSEVILDKDSLKWINSNRGLILISNDFAKRVPDIDLVINNLYHFNDYYWIVTHNDVYQVDPNLKINIDFSQNRTSWKSIIEYFFPKNTFISGLIEPDIYYQNKLTGKKSHDGEFDLIIESNKEEFIKKIQNQRFSAEGTVISFSTGYYKYDIALKDKYGNSFIYNYNFKVLPAEYLLPLIIIIIWLSAIFGIIALAPFSRFAHNILMNPWIRNIGSFGLFPLVISISTFFRNYLLIRYVRNFLRDEEITDALTHFVVPHPDFEFDSFVNLLETEQKLFLLGPSGIGKTSYFLYLARTFADRKSRQKFFKSPIPVLIPLSRYMLESPEQIFYTQLHKYGDISDEYLSKWFLKQGGFLILIDGLNEVNSDTRNQINSFTDKHCPRNFLCLSSQVGYSEFAWIKKFHLSGLNENEILKFINSYFPITDKANVKLDKERISIYSNPQNLSFGIRLLQDGRELPANNLQLYTELLKPIKTEWENNNYFDNFPILTQRAFYMLNNKQVFIESEGDISDTIIIPLLENKLIVKRNNKYQFKHDLVKAYLASLYLSVNLKSAFQLENIKLDLNWRSCFEFLVFQIKTEEDIRFLLFNLLSLNIELATHVFGFMKDNKLKSITTNLEDEFTVRLGELTLKASYNRGTVLKSK